MKLTNLNTDNVQEMDQINLQQNIKKIINKAYPYGWSPHLLTDIKALAAEIDNAAINNYIDKYAGNANVSKEELIILVTLFRFSGKTSYHSVSELIHNLLSDRLLNHDIYFLVHALLQDHIPLPRSLVYDITERLLLNIEIMYKKIVNDFSKVPAQNTEKVILFLTLHYCRKDLNTQNKEMVGLILSHIEGNVPTKLKEEVKEFLANTFLKEISNTGRNVRVNRDLYKDISRRSEPSNSKSGVQSPWEEMKRDMERSQREREERKGREPESPAANKRTRLDESIENRNKARKKEAEKPKKGKPPYSTEYGREHTQKHRQEREKASERERKQREELTARQKETYEGNPYTPPFGKTEEDKRDRSQPENDTTKEQSAAPANPKPEKPENYYKEPTEEPAEKPAEEHPLDREQLGKPEKHQPDPKQTQGTEEPRKSEQPAAKTETGESSASAAKQPSAEKQHETAPHPQISDEQRQEAAGKHEEQRKQAEEREKSQRQELTARQRKSYEKKPDSTPAEKSQAETEEKQQHPEGPAETEKPLKREYPEEKTKHAGEPDTEPAETEQPTSPVKPATFEKSPKPAEPEKPADNQTQTDTSQAGISSDVSPRREKAQQQQKPSTEKSEPGDQEELLPDEDTQEDEEEYQFTYESASGGVQGIKLKNLDLDALTGEDDEKNYSDDTIEIQEEPEEAPKEETKPADKEISETELEPQLDKEQNEDEAPSQEKQETKERLQTEKEKTAKPPAKPAGYESTPPLKKTKKQDNRKKPGKKTAGAGIFALLAATAITALVILSPEKSTPPDTPPEQTATETQQAESSINAEAETSQLEPAPQASEENAEAETATEPAAGAEAESPGETETGAAEGVEETPAAETEEAGVPAEEPAETEAAAPQGTTPVTIGQGENAYTFLTGQGGVQWQPKEGDNFFELFEYLQDNPQQAEQINTGIENMTWIEFLNNLTELNPDITDLDLIYPEGIYTIYSTQ